MCFACSLFGVTFDRRGFFCWMWDENYTAARTITQTDSLLPCGWLWLWYLVVCKSTMGFKLINKQKKQKPALNLHFTEKFLVLVKLWIDKKFFKAGTHICVHVWMYKCVISPKHRKIKFMEKYKRKHRHSRIWIIFYQWNFQNSMPNY